MAKVPSQPDRHVTNEPAPFVMVPEALLYDSSLSHLAVRLYAVLRRHGSDPEDCYPSKRRLSDLMGCAPASLGRPARELEEAGWIERVERFHPDGQQWHNAYVVRATARAHSARPPAQESAPPRAPERDLERESLERESLKTPAALPFKVADPFDAFWDEYPRTVEKIKARKRWAAQLKRGVDPRDLIAAAANYARARQMTPPDKIKLPATFLSADDVWRDWLDGGAALAEAEQGEVYVTDEPIYS